MGTPPRHCVDTVHPGGNVIKEVGQLAGASTGEHLLSAADLKGLTKLRGHEAHRDLALLSPRSRQLQAAHRRFVSDWWKRFYLSIPALTFGGCYSSASCVGTTLKPSLPSSQGRIGSSPPQQEHLGTSNKRRAASPSQKERTDQGF